MTREVIAADIKLVNEGLGVGMLIANGAIKAKPTDLETMHRARDAFARLRMHLAIPPPRTHDEIAAARQAHNLSI